MMKKHLLLAVSLSSAVLIGCSNFSDAQTQAQISQDNPSTTKTAAKQPFNYQDYSQVLETYVNDRGLVDYSGLQADREQLDRFNQSLGTVSPETYNSWGESEQIAFLTNAYNAFTLQSIIDRDPLEDSIRDISGVWNRRKFILAGEERTLDNIEHDILREDFNEPRIHVALVCAAISCPPLRNEPYTGKNLDAQLAEQTVKFADSPHGLKLDREDNKVYISSIFKWYGKDFIKTYGIEDKFAGNDQQRAVLNYFSGQLKPKDSQFVESGDYDVKYLDYDWSLNIQ